MLFQINELTEAQIRWAILHHFTKGNPELSEKEWVKLGHPLGYLTVLRQGSKGNGLGVVIEYFIHKAELHPVIYDTCMVQNNDQNHIRIAYMCKIRGIQCIDTSMTLVKCKALLVYIHGEYVDIQDTLE